MPKEAVKSVGQEIKNQVIDRDLQSGYRVVIKEGLDLAKALASGNPKILALTLVKKGIKVPLKLGKALIESDSISM